MLSGSCQKELKTHLHKNLHVDVYSSFNHNCQKVEAIVFFNEWMDKQTGIVYPDNKILLSTKKKSAIKPWTDGRALNAY